MGHLVQIASGYRGVAFEDGSVLSAGQQKVISDAEFDDIPGFLVGTMIIDLDSSVADPLDPSAQSAVNSANAYTDAAKAAAIATAAATALGYANTAQSTAQTYADTNKVGKGELMVSVKDYGAVGDGTTLDEAAINAAITANPGRTIFFPRTSSNTYLINALAYTGAGSQPVGIKLNQAGVRLLLDPAVTIKAQTNNSQHYSVIQVTAADCSIEGGTVMGDVATHTGSGGEWGHCIDIITGADRCRVQRVKCTKGWGDGIVISGAVADVSIIDVVADDNRRQGMSITDAVRTRVVGGVYMNTGLTAYTGPGAGIDIEPSTGQSIVDVKLVGVLAWGNKGNGILTSANGRPFTVTVDGCTAIGNGTGTSSNGFLAAGTTNNTTYVACVAENNAQDGFFSYSDTNGIVFANCMARINQRFGFAVVGDYTKLIGCVARDSQRTGIYIDPSADGTTITGGETLGNSQVTTNNYPNVDVQGTNTRIDGHISDAGTATNKPSYGFLIRAGGSGTRITGCDVRNTFGTANYSDLSTTAVLMPPPGAGLSTAQIFNASGTWTKPAGATRVYVAAIGGGSGGGSGRRGAAGSVRCGGGAGGGGGQSSGWFAASDLGSTVSVTVGTGGGGGAAVTADSTSGNAGSAGANSLFGTHVNARAGGGGGGGTASTGTAGSGGIGVGFGVVGGAASTTGGVGAGGGATAGGAGAGGGGAGGGISSSDVAANGGAGSVCYIASATTGGAAGVVDTTAPTQGTASALGYLPAPGAGGGAASITTVAQSGANGLVPGGAGGGGGASLNGNNSGAGGNGGAGMVYVVTYFD